MNIIINIMIIIISSSRSIAYQFLSSSPFACVQVCFAMFMPTLLHNFLYAPPKFTLRIIETGM